MPNPTRTLDFARFSSDELLDYYCAERDVLRGVTPGVPVTTNFMVTSHVSGMDYWKWAGEQDLVSQDHYLDGRLEDPRAELAFCADLTRGLAGGGPWFLMEHSTSAVNWQPVNYAKAPGELLSTSLAHVARGADAVGFFQWRASRAGAEKFHSGLVPHAGTDTVVWREVCRLGDVLRRCSDVAGTRVVAGAALLFDWQAWWACNTEGHPSGLVRYPDAALAAHAALRRRGVTADVVRPGADLRAYRLVVVPTLYLVDDAAAESLRDYVEGGGHALVTYWSGVVDENDHVRLGGYPGAFRDLLGVRTQEFFPLAPGAQVEVVHGDAAAGWTATTWTELTDLAGATATATYVTGPLAGHPAVTRHEYGAGVAWYLGTAPSPIGYDAVMAAACDEAGLGTTEPATPGVEIVARRGDAGSFLFVTNHLQCPVSLPLDGYDLVADEPVVGQLQLAAGGVAVVREARESGGR